MGARSPTSTVLSDLSLDDAFSEVVRELWDEDPHDDSASKHELPSAGRRGRESARRRLSNSDRPGTTRHGGSVSGDSPTSSHARGRSGGQGGGLSGRDAPRQRSPSRSPGPEAGRAPPSSRKPGGPNSAQRRPPRSLREDSASDTASSYAKDPDEINVEDLHHAIHEAAGDKELAARVAYENLQSLAGMSRRIQEAVEHSRVLFERRVKSAHAKLLGRAFGGWRAARYGGEEKRNHLARVLRRMSRLKQAQALAAWVARHALKGPIARMVSKAKAVVCRGKMVRAYQAWWKVVLEGMRAREMQFREHFVIKEHDDAMRRRRERGAVRTYQRKLMGKVWAVLDFNFQQRMSKKGKLNKALMYWNKSCMAKGMNAWTTHCQTIKRRRGLLKKAAMRMVQAQIGRAWSAWYDVHMELQRHQRLVAKALLRMKNRLASAAMQSWSAYLMWKRKKQTIMNRWKNPFAAKSFYGWLERHNARVGARSFARGVLLKMSKRRLAAAFSGWMYFMQVMLDERNDDFAQKAATKIENLTAENGRLRRDNERFVRLIDSGEWGRSRVDEMSRAGEVLRAERNELSRLIQQLRDDYARLEESKRIQESENRDLKDRICSGNFVQRNKLIVKGGSSFNGLVRAIKSDVAESGIAQRNPTLVYGVEKMSMDTVTVFPDGELNIQAVKTKHEPMSLGPSHFGPRPSQTSRRAGKAPVQVRTPSALATLPERGGTPRGSKIEASNVERTGKLINALQNLTPQEVDKLEQVIKRERKTKAAGPAERARVLQDMGSAM